MMAAKRSRLSVDKEVSVEDAQAMLEGFTIATNSRGFIELVKPFSHQGWTSAPTAKMLVTTGPLCSRIVDVYSNGILSHQKFCVALKACHGTKPCIFACGPINETIGAISKDIRVALAKYRDIKRDARERRVALALVYV